MSFLNFFRRKAQAEPTVQHSVFGQIQYVDRELWERGRIRFAPTGTEVALLINAPATGPDHRHVQFLQDVATRWPNILDAGEPIARDTLKDWIEKPESGELWPRLKLE